MAFRLTVCGVHGRVPTGETTGPTRGVCEINGDALMLSLSPGRLFTGRELIEGATVHVQQGKVMRVDRNGPAGIRLEGILAPGLIDLQVNGGGGVMFNDDPGPETLRTITLAHTRRGVTGIMATLISDTREKLAAAMEAVAAGRAEGMPGLLGLHLEGPWLSGAKRGVHHDAYLRRLDDGDLELLAKPREFPVMVTLAPEQASAAHVRALADAGVAVCIGHTSAQADAVEALVEAGARGFTHLFNAMPALEGRQPGPLAVALAGADTWSGLILDGIHVHPWSARVAFAAKTARKLMLVSDAMATVGSTDTSMQLFGQRICLHEGALRTPDGRLAGAHLDLVTAMRNAVSMLKATTEEAFQMASLTPAQFLGIDRDHGRIEPGSRADFALFGPELDIRGVWLGGEQVC